MAKQAVRIPNEGHRSVSPPAEVQNHGWQSSGDLAGQIEGGLISNTLTIWSRGHRSPTETTFRAVDTET
jgi:hypothetical protein